MKVERKERDKKFVARYVRAEALQAFASSARRLTKRWRWSLLARRFCGSLPPTPVAKSPFPAPSSPTRGQRRELQKKGDPLCFSIACCVSRNGRRHRGGVSRLELRKAFVHTLQFCLGACLGFPKGFQCLFCRLGLHQEISSGRDIEEIGDPIFQICMRRSIGQSRAFVIERNMRRHQSGEFLSDGLEFVLCILCL